MNANPILPWHKKAAKEILQIQATGYHGADMNDNDAAKIISRHDPYFETTQLLATLVNECTPMPMSYTEGFPGVSFPSKKTLEQARAHLRKMKGAS